MMPSWICSVLDEARMAAVNRTAVDGIQVVVVAQGRALLGVDVLAEGRVQVGSLQVVCGQGVAGQNGVNIAVLR